MATVTGIDAKRDFVHGPRTERVSSECRDCNYDTHTCPGCGEWLHHGTTACGPCMAEAHQQIADYDALPVAPVMQLFGNRP